jgi:hypothetical protein
MPLLHRVVHGGSGQREATRPAFGRHEAGPGLGELRQRSLSPRPIHASRHALCLGHDAQHVAAGQAGQVRIAPTTKDQFREEVRVPRDVPQPLRVEHAPVEVATEPHVLQARHARDVLHVVGDH